MRVRSLELTNVRQFKHKRLEFGPGFNLLVGENGAGKSTVLRSLLTVLGHAANLRATDQLGDDDIRYRADEFRARVECHVGDSVSTAEIHRRWRETSRRKGRIAHGPIIWFGPNESMANTLRGEKVRRLRDGKDERRRDRKDIWLREEYLYREEFMYPDEDDEAEFGRSEHVRRFVGRALSAFSPKFERFVWRFVPYDCVIRSTSASIVSGTSEMRVFRDEVRAKIMRFLESDEPPRHRYRGWGDRRSVVFKGNGQPVDERKRMRPVHEFHDIVQMAAKRMGLSDAVSDVRIHIKLAPRIYVFGPDGAFLLSQLSDGEKRIFSMIVDIARQLSLERGGWRELEMAPGLVVIDEIDCHLHPKWQRMIVKALEDLFPACQFIATTHSPFVVQAVEAHQLQSLGSELLPDFANRGIEEIAVKVMRIEDPEVSLRYLELLDVAKQYYATLEETRDAVGVRLQELKDRLEQLSSRYARNPAFQAYLEMKRQGLLGPNSGI